MADWTPETDLWSPSDMNLAPASFSLAAVMFLSSAGVAPLGLSRLAQPDTHVADGVAVAPASMPEVTPVSSEPAQAQPPQVAVVDRSQWGATGGQGAPIGQVDEVVVHHFWKPSLNRVAGPEPEIEMMRQVERTHVEENGWSGFGYSFVVFQSGRVYEGRGWGREGAHTVGKNDETIGIAFAIDGDRVEPTPQAWAAAKALIEDGVAAGHLTADVSITGHTDYADKSCPGENVYPLIAQLAPDPT